MSACYSLGEDKESALMNTIMFRPAVMVFAVGGLRHKSPLLIVKRSITTEQLN
jgi:hypothetical protein